MSSRLMDQLIVAIGLGVATGAVVGFGLILSWTQLNVAAYAVTTSSVPIETLTPIPTIAPTPMTTSLRTITATLAAAPRPRPTRTLTAQRSGRRVEHFLFGRPLALDVSAPAPNPLYLYGTTELGQYEVHHGVDFDRNPIGEPVYAVGDGVVVSAGDDRQPLCGVSGKQVCGRFVNFYGLVTVIRFDQKYHGKTMFAVYGHQDRLDVRVGQRVKRGEAIGTVGMSGIAIGPHIQFEIRLGANDYASTRNPMLWIAPLPGRGVLAGRYTAANGVPIASVIVDIYRADEPNKFYRETETYGADEQPDVVPDAEYGENFVMSDLPAGDYIVRVPGKLFAVRVSVPKSGLGWVEIGE